MTVPAALRTIGTRVSYEDVCNPRKPGTVIDTDTGAWGTQYVVQWDDAPEGPHQWTDLRQSGWRVEPALPVVDESDTTVEALTGQLRIAVELEQLELAL